ncbi:UbiA family prenyltransferase [Microcoleus sp. FACHB-1515]|uniref:UbiA family prenyltransferase n=1 Tax=Cyanophyceae TaxID=3028117 RepID=UPI001683AE22|nr:UbiA family prenyltransferase [Microcoleus sp. FACHB-1515]MBD2091231.1 UbiA family prenyltransferase [Microcoleus sp. FACHB-1515]
MNKSNGSLTLSQETLNDYLSLIRFKFHTNFAFVVLGVISFAEKIDASLFAYLVILYFSFNVCLYGGIYTVNAITDLEKDAKHPLKKNRPLPSGRIPKKAAATLAISLISIGTAIGFLCFGVHIGLIYLAFVGVNLFYSLIARNIPYLELFVNATTMPLRLLMGTLLVTDDRMPVLLMFAAFCTGIGFLAVRRIVEKDVAGWGEGRPALKSYQGGIMPWLQIVFFVGLILAFKFDPLLDRSWIAYTIMLIYYIIFCLGMHVFKPIRVYWRQIYGS